MTRVELEELLSAYMDGELSPPTMKKVDALVKTDAQAKSILDGYLSVRAAIQRQADTYQVPVGFTASVLAAIDATAPQSKRFGGVRYETASRWRNPRIFAYPLVVLVCALFIGLFYRSERPDSPPGRTPFAQNTEQPQPDETRIPPPLSLGAGPVAPSDISARPEVPQDLKFVCHVENMASVSTLFPQIFANYDVDWKKSTSGPTNTVVYEISVRPETLRNILEEFQAHPMEITGETANIGTEHSIKVFFQVESL